jgi:hypothetical protein
VKGHEFTRAEKALEKKGGFSPCSPGTESSQPTADYFPAGGGVKISRFRPGSTFGFGFGAFFTSFLPLSLFPMKQRMT